MSVGRKSVVTGAVGFVGGHLVDALIARGDDVLATDVATAPHRSGVKYQRVDITDYDSVKKALEGADVVFHNASVVHTKQNLQDRVWAVNLDGSRNVLRACRELGVKRLVYVSSASAVYEGSDIENGDEKMPYSRISQAPYADSKIAAEKELLASNGKDGVLVCAIRPHVIFGPGDRRLVPNLLSRAKEGKLKFSVGRKLNKLSDFTYIDNLVAALLAADERLVEGSPVPGQAYFVTNGEPMNFWDFVDKFIVELGYEPIKMTVPYPVAYGVAAVMEGLDTLRGGTLGQEDGMTRFAIKYMCTHHYFSVAKARRELGYEPKITIADGIRRTVAHLRAIGEA